MSKSRIELDILSYSCKHPYHFLQIKLGQWFSPGTPVSSPIKLTATIVTKILLKVALNTLSLTLPYKLNCISAIRNVRIQQEDIIIGMTQSVHERPIHNKPLTDYFIIIIKLTDLSLI